jgi:hypothetical protein
MFDFFDTKDAMAVKLREMYLMAIEAARAGGQDLV